MTNPALITGDRDNSVMVFAELYRQFYHEVTILCHLAGLFHLDNFIVTRNFSSVYRDFAKTTKFVNINSN
jgi:hypothetical protein